MRDQASEVDAEGVVGVRLFVEHHMWRGGHTVAKFIALGTAIGFDHDHGPEEFQGAPSLRLEGGKPFTSDLNGQDFVSLLRAGYRPVTLAMGSCVYEVDPTVAYSYYSYQGAWVNEEIPSYTQAFFDARELAMERLEQDLWSEWQKGRRDAPIGVVGMTVEELAHGEGYKTNQTAVVEFTAVGTAVAKLEEKDPRRAAQHASPHIVVPLDR
jgi:uncharacterized protein YbjQ (UPF0145 family)